MSHWAICYAGPVTQEELEQDRSFLRERIETLEAKIEREDLSEEVSMEAQEIGQANKSLAMISSIERDLEESGEESIDVAY